MSRSLAFAALALVIVATLVLGRWKSAREAHARATWSAAIRAVIDTTHDAGWVETFETQRSQTLSEYDPRWRPIFGRLLVHRRLGAAIGDPEGGWERDGGDDYSFRSADVPTGSVEIVVDGWWDGHGSIGAQGAVQADRPHRLYEAALWRGKVAIIYFLGPAPNQFEVLAESVDPPVQKGFYRLVFRMNRSGGVWSLHATLQDPAKAYAVVGKAAASDNRLGEGAQGIGILGGGGASSSYVTGLAVRTASRDTGVRKKN